MGMVNDRTGSSDEEASKPLDSRSVTGGEYKAQVRIHRGVLIHDY